MRPANSTPGLGGKAPLDWRRGRSPSCVDGGLMGIPEKGERESVRNNKKKKQTNAQTLRDRARHPGGGVDDPKRTLRSRADVQRRPGPTRSQGPVAALLRGQ